MERKLVQNEKVPVAFIFLKKKPKSEFIVLKDKLKDTTLIWVLY